MTSPQIILAADVTTNRQHANVAEVEQRLGSLELILGISAVRKTVLIIVSPSFGSSTQAISTIRCFSRPSVTRWSLFTIGSSMAHCRRASGRRFRC